MTLARADAEDLARLVGRRGLAVELSRDPDHLLHERGVRGCEPAWREPEVVLESHAHLPAEDERDSGEVELPAVADAGDGPGVLAEQLLGALTEVDELLRPRADRSEHAHDELHVHRTIEQVVVLFTGTQRALRVNTVFWGIGMVSMTILLLVLLFTSQESFIAAYNGFVGDPNAYQNTIAAARDAGFIERNSLLMLWPLVAVAMAVFGWYFWMTYFGAEISRRARGAARCG